MPLFAVRSAEPTELRHVSETSAHLKAVEHCRDAVSTAVCEGAVRRCRRNGPWLRMAILFPCLLAAGCGDAGDRLAVHKVEGVVHRDGRPLADALVVFHPKDSSVGPISPRATSGADGRFQLTTYDHQDGAPAGSYAVTVTRFEPIVSGNSSEPGPNVLDKKLATKESTDIFVEVREGENQLEPIEVDR